jgi:cell division protein FtsN
MKSQQGGFAVGLVVGLLLGLGLALGVALYVTKVPLPFINKVPQRTAEQDAAEAERNKNWNPNAPLVGKPARPGASAAAPATARTAPPASNDPVPIATLPATPPSPAAAASASKPARAPGADPFIYFAQAGAYTRAEDAEAQRAKLALLGANAKLSEREQAGRTIYRVRVGPFETRAQVDAVLERLRDSGVESSLVRVERQ